MKAAESENLLKKHPLAAGCVLAALLFGGAAYYRSSATPEREALLDQKTAEGQRLQNNITNAALLKEQYDSLAAINRQLSDMLINRGQVAENAGFFYRIEAATNTKITDPQMTMSANAAKGGKARFVPVSYSFSVTGDYRSVLNFVRKLEKSPRLAKVTAATISEVRADQSASAPVSLALSVELLAQP
jgi:Tfp pilus assembly protein PilO